jgi:aminoglycoside phosphotransferase (APT) family kinase protein
VVCDGLALRIERLIEREDCVSLGEVLELRAMAGGLSRSTWQVRLRVTRSTGERTEQDLVLQLLPESGLLASDLAAEFNLLSALTGSAVPAPQPCSLDADGSVLGSPGLVNGRVEGECDPWVSPCNMETSPLRRGDARDTTQVR